MAIHLFLFGYLLWYLEECLLGNSFIRGSTNAFS